MKNYSPSEIINVFYKKKYRLKTNLLELNLFGIRNKGSQANTFDDIVGCLYKDEDGKWIALQFTATTDPGTYYREHPMNINGTAIMAPGQYLDCYKIGMHTRYKAFQQIGKMGYIRDNDKNGILNYLLYSLRGNIRYEVAATNIHHANANAESKIVDKWSAGCQVIALFKNLNIMLAIGEEGIDKYKYNNLFDYTLFENDEIMKYDEI